TSRRPGWRPRRRFESRSARRSGHERRGRSERSDDREERTAVAKKASNERGIQPQRRGRSERSDDREERTTVTQKASNERGGRAMSGQQAVRIPGALLATVSCPEDLRHVSSDDLTGLASDIRAELVDSVTRTGGHLGPHLGVVELTIALHRVFESPKDVLIWDIGHQAYVHKMLTGRTSELRTLRQSGGLSGYPSRAESDHDVVENSTAATAP